jgi:HEAT repeat protein
LHLFQKCSRDGACSSGRALRIVAIVLCTLAALLAGYAALVIVLQRRCSDPDPLRRMKALTWLGVIEGRAALPRIEMALLRDGMPGMRIHAATIMESFDTEESRRLLIDALGRERDPLVLAALCHIVADFPEKDLTVLLSGRLDRTDSRTEAFCLASALGRRGDRAAVPSLCKAFGRFPVPVRWQVPLSLGKMRDVRALAVLKAGLGDPDEYVRGNSLWAVGMCGGPEYVHVAQGYLEDSSAYVRLCAAETIVFLGGEAPQQVIEMLNQSRNGAIRARAATLAKKIPLQSE